MSAPRVSIVIPTRNGISTLPALLDRLAGQRVDAAVEVIAVDSASTDGTAALLRDRVDRLIAIEAAGFDHGLTRNLGIEAASGDLVVLTVQDALPADDRWLAALIAPLRADPRLAGTFARQRPRPDASALTRQSLARWVAAGETPRVVFLDRAAFARLSPRERLDRCAFDNVCSCIRRSVWLAHPFRATPIAEDLEWAKTVLLAGHALAFVPDAVVVHSHERGAREEFTRTREVHRRLRALFGLRTIPSLPALGRAVASSLARHVRCRREDGGRMPLARAVGLAVAWPLGQYLGGRASTRPPSAAQPETA